MSDLPKNVMTVESAIDAAISAYESGDLETAAGVVQNILRHEPSNRQALLIALWVARRADDGGIMFDEATRKLIEADDVWRQVPQYLPADRAPVCQVPGIERFYYERLPAPSDISDHLPTLYHETLAARPRLVVELGTRGGESTRTFLAAAAKAGARMLSIDVDPCTVPGLPAEARRLWTFVQSDDVAFSRQDFVPWCRANGLAAEIDVLFVDTSHLYAHTVEELRVWMPFLSDRGVAIFHDTNLDTSSRRYDGSIVWGWANERGVIRAIEEHVGQRLDEKRPFVAEAGGWLIRHVPYCNGLTTLRRVS
ncbi:MAG: class I SAM-dependent methyltransferase [Rhodospirillaceae bacterium]|nr:class I SAM-dependent methyltransferase [Rhodospirillaceae bacterium]